MKKVFLLSTIALLGAATILPSCNKKGNYTCQCTELTSNTQVTPVPYTDMKKKDAQKACDNIAAQGKSVGISMECVLK